MGIGIETASTANTHRPGVEGSFGSTGQVRGMQGSAETAIKEVDPGPDAILSLSGKGEVTVRTGKGPGGETYTTFDTPEPTTPLKRIDLNA